MRKARSAEVAARVENLAGVDETTWAALKRDLAPISDSYLRTLLRNTGTPLAPIIEGVRTSTLADAKRTLTALAREYSETDRARQKELRAPVLQAKQRLRARTHIESHTASEVLLWVNTWLENPAIFEEWIRLREGKFSTVEKLSHDTDS